MSGWNRGVLPNPSGKNCCKATRHRSARARNSTCMKTEPPNPIEQHKAKFQQLRARIASHPFLKGMPADQLATLAIYSMESSFTAGQSIFHEGDIANRFYLIEE